MNKFPLWFYFGIFLNLTFWIISWSQLKPFSYYSFFFLWVGYILIVDGLNFRIKKISMLSQSSWSFLFIFILGGIFWWYFEFVVEITKNWYYISTKEWGSISRGLAATLFFSTFFLSILETVSLVDNLKIFKPQTKFIKANNKWPLIFFITGIISIPVTIYYPQYFFPFLWITLFLLIDPLNYWGKRDSLISDAINNKWGRIFTLASGGIICGIFWEFWNYYADPKWIYSVPFVGFAKIFEMPILGYLGYIPFAFELFCVYSLIQDSFGFPKDNFFTLDKLKAHRKIDFRLVLMIGVIIIFLLNIFIQSSNSNFDSYPNIEAKKSISYQTSQHQIFIGEVFYCGLGISQKYNCLIGDDNNIYILQNSSGEFISTSLGKRIVSGDLLQPKIGANIIQVKDITKL